MARRILQTLIASVLTAPWSAPCAQETEPTELLPDIVVRASDLANNEILEVAGGNRRILRFANGTGNFGEGKLLLKGVLPGASADRQTIVQRIFATDGSFRDRDAGVFIFHSGHSHIHVDDWARYRIRKMLPDQGVGEVVAESDKVSFCILDLTLAQPDLPNAASRPEFTSCSSTTQGLSVGWVDVYGKNLPGQSIDVTDLPDALYWLESEVDPENHILESNDDNNIARIPIPIGGVTEVPDSFEPNDDLTSVLAALPGQPNSANLGPCNPTRRVDSLNLHAPDNRDLFAFYLPSQGIQGTFVRIDFATNDGDLDLLLRDPDDNEVAHAMQEGGNSEQIDFAGLDRGWYVVEVLGEGTHADYSLTVVPPRNEPPSVTVLTPAAGNLDLVHSSEGLTVSWEHSDPEGNEAWVTLYVNDVPERNGHEEQIPTGFLLDADVGVAVINSADLKPGQYWIYAEITDGGSTGGSWSPGTVTFHSYGPECQEGDPLRDCNGNGVSDLCEVERGILADCDDDKLADICGLAPDHDGDGVPDICQKPRFRRGDSNHDGDVDIADATHVLGVLFLGNATPSCAEASNANNDLELDISDGVTILRHLFLGGASIAPPGPECGSDPEPDTQSNDLGCEVYNFCS